ncbi:MAG: hypothetical protein V4459_05365 [Pseudomonadota bacterium]
MRAILAALVVLAAGPGERLVAPVPAGFVVGYSVARGTMAIEERVPKGESVELWSRMITVQRFTGGARFGARMLLDRIKASLPGGCPGGTTSGVVESTIDQRTYASMRADCPLNPATGKPETFFARTVVGADDLYSVQYAYRAVPSNAESMTAEAYLAGIRLCPGADRACAP